MSQDERVQIGERIRSARKRKGISQVQLAEALAERFGGEAENIRRSLVNNEQGKYAPRMRTLEAIADITEQPLDYFRSGSTLESPPAGGPAEPSPFPAAA